MTSRAEHVPSLDVLRGLLALAVATYHFQTWTRVFGSGTSASNTVAVIGIYSVEGFFIISGFCFFHLYSHTSFGARALKLFYVKRFLRLAPLYYFALLLNLVLGRPVGAMGWTRLLENITLSFGLFHPNHARVLGGWSVGLEVVFYLAFPLLAWLVRSRVALYGASGLLIALAVVHPMNISAGASQWVRFHAYVELPNHAFLFLLGGIVADLRRLVPTRIPSWGLAFGVALVVAISALLQPHFYDHFDVMTGLPRVRHLTACFATVLLAGFHVPYAGVLARPLHRLGDLSYSLYLLHPFASVAAIALVPVAISPVLTFGLGMILTLVFAALSRHFVEQPAIDWGKRLAGRAVRRSACADDARPRPVC